MALKSSSVAPKGLDVWTGRAAASGCKACLYLANCEPRSKDHRKAFLEGKGYCRDLIGETGIGTMSSLTADLVDITLMRCSTVATSLKFEDANSRQ